MEAGPHSMKLASLRSRMRCRLLCTCVGSTSPCMHAAPPPQGLLAGLLFPFSGHCADHMPAPGLAPAHAPPDAPALVHLRRVHLPLRAQQAPLRVSCQTTLRDLLLQLVTATICTRGPKSWVCRSDSILPIIAPSMAKG